MKTEMPRDTHLRVLSVLFLIVAAPLLLVLVLSPIALARVVLEPSAYSADDRIGAYIMLPIAFLLGLYGVFLAIASRKLSKRKPRAGWWAFVACVTWMPTGLMPFGAYGLYALLRPNVRTTWWP
jgi:hypothetical protein